MGRVVCAECGKEVSKKVEEYSKEKYGKVLCYGCQHQTKFLESEEKVKEPEGEVEEWADEMEEAEIEETIRDIISQMPTLEEKDKFHAWVASKYGAPFLQLTKEQKSEILEYLREREADKGTEEEEEGERNIETTEGKFSFREEADKIVCTTEKGGEYELDINEPSCSCADFQINKQRKEWCKHLKAAAQAGFVVKELTPVHEELKQEIAIASAPPAERKKRVKKEEVVAIKTIESGKEVEIPVQRLRETVMGEDHAIEIIKKIVGTNPKKDDVIESYAGIEEINADVIASLGSYLGIQCRIVEIETEKTKMNLGKIYMLTAAEDKKKKYGGIAELMPEVDIVTRCKVTVAAAWADENGNKRIALGVKEELLTPYDLADIASRGANFIETKAITKAVKKAIISVLPITHNGLKSKIKQAFSW